MFIALQKLQVGFQINETLFFNIRFIKIFVCIKKGGNKFLLLNVCLTVYLPILFTAALDFSRISPFKGTNPSDGALS